jgi:hypothetical protein
MSGQAEKASCARGRHRRHGWDSVRSRFTVNGRYYTRWFAGRHRNIVTGLGLFVLFVVV